MHHIESPRTDDSAIEQDLRAADKAVMSGDVVAMLRSLETLRGIKD